MGRSEVQVNNKTADLLELKTGCLPIEFDGIEGLFVFVEPGCTNRLAIAGQRGITILSAAQCARLAADLPKINEMYLEVKPC